MPARPPPLPAPPPPPPPPRAANWPQQPFYGQSHCPRCLTLAPPLHPTPGGLSDRLRRITKEVATLPGQLPLSWESAILAAMDEDNMGVLRWVGGGWVLRMLWWGGGPLPGLREVQGKVPTGGRGVHCKMPAHPLRG